MTYHTFRQRLQQWWHSSATPSASPTPSGVVIHMDAIADQLATREPDALTMVGRAVAAEVLAHPEKFTTHVMGVDTLVVADDDYEALFYLFSGKTRQRLWAEDKKVAAIMLYDHTIISQKLLTEARRAERGWG